MRKSVQKYLRANYERIYKFDTRNIHYFAHKKTGRRMVITDLLLNGGEEGCITGMGGHVKTINHKPMSLVMFVAMEKEL